jgi:hypothetical protein
MVMRFMPWFVFFALVTGSSPSNAQVPAGSLIAGDLVQYELSKPLRAIPEQSRGTFEALSPSIVILSAVEDLDTGALVELPLELIADFEVKRGTKDIRWLGAAIGVGAGFAVGLTITDPDQTPTATGIIAVPILGGLLGYLFGSAIKGPRWEDVEFN